MFFTDALIFLCTVLIDLNHVVSQITAEETMTTYRVGIIGLGRMGSTIDDEQHAIKPYSIAACCAEMDQ